MATTRAAIVLAAGKGKRMKSDIPKVLHELNGKPLINIVLENLGRVGFDRTVVVVGFEGEMVVQAVRQLDVEIAWQRQQLGTGHAVLMTEEILGDFEGTTLVALGDMPLLSASSINALLGLHERTGAAATCLSAILDDPSGYGRVVREGDTNMLREIVEHKDAGDEIRAIKEVNTGLFCFDNQQLFAALSQVRNDNSQGEYYLPDTIKIMRAKGLPVAVIAAKDAREGLGVNSLDQLQQLEKDIVS
ncbi:MAG: NTP transferase domain-containing protein [bacterium]